MNVINEFQGKHRFLSNFYLVDIEHEGIIYPSVEHAYQAAKTNNLEEKKKIAGLKKPGAAKRHARTLDKLESFEQNKVRIMKELVKKKFGVPYLQKWLLDTGTAVLIEGNRWNDTFWGVDLASGRGQNWMGRILMEIRKELREHAGTT